MELTENAHFNTMHETFCFSITCPGYNIASWMVSPLWSWDLQICRKNRSGKTFVFKGLARQLNISLLLV